MEALERVTGLTAPQRRRVLAWVARLPEEDVASLLAGIDERLPAAGAALPDRSRLYAAFILSARAAGWDALSGRGFRVAGEAEFAVLAQLRYGKGGGREGRVKRQVLAHWGEVCELRVRGWGFRRIASYLKKERRVRVSPTYLFELWGERR